MIDHWCLWYWFISVCKAFCTTNCRLSNCISAFYDVDRQSIPFSRAGAAVATTSIQNSVVLSFWRLLWPLGIQSVPVQSIVAYNMESFLSWAGPQSFIGPVNPYAIRSWHRKQLRRPSFYTRLILASVNWLFTTNCNAGPSQKLVGHFDCKRSGNDILSSWSTGHEYYCRYSCQNHIIMSLKTGMQYSWFVWDKCKKRFGP